MVLQLASVQCGTLRGIFAACIFYSHASQPEKLCAGLIHPALPPALRSSTHHSYAGLERTLSADAWGGAPNESSGTSI